MKRIIGSACVLIWVACAPVWASEQVETFESAGFDNHVVVTNQRATDLLVISIEAGGSQNMKEVTGPAALFVGFDPSAPVTELSIKRPQDQRFTLRRLTLTDQFEMEEEVRIRAFRAGEVVGDFSAAVPWPMGDVVMPTDGSFRSVDEVRLSAKDMYFYLEDIAFQLEGGNELNGGQSAEPIPVLRSSSVAVLVILMLLVLAWIRPRQMT